MSNTITVSRDTTLRYNRLRRIVTYDKSGQFSFHICGADTRHEIVALLPRIAKACGNHELAAYAAWIAKITKRNGV